MLPPRDKLGRFIKVDKAPILWPPAGLAELCLDLAHGDGIHALWLAMVATWEWHDRNA